MSTDEPDSSDLEQKAYSFQVPGTSQIPKTSSILYPAIAPKKVNSNQIPGTGFKFQNLPYES